MAAAAGRAIQKLPKPNLRNHFRDHLVKTFYFGLPAATVLSLVYYVTQVKVRKRRYEAYYGSLTPEKINEDFERMRKLGVFQAAPPDGQPYMDFTQEE